MAMDHPSVALLMTIVAAVSGCAPRLSSVPVEKIDASTVNRLQRVYCGSFARYTTIERLIDPSDAIGPVAVDGNHRLLYVRHRTQVGLGWGTPVTVDVHNLESGKRVESIRIPRYRDMSGNAISSQDSAFIDVKLACVYIQQYWGAGEYQVVRLTSNGTPKAFVPEAETYLPWDPVIDDTHLVLAAGGRSEQRGVMVIDRQSGELLSSWKFPRFVGKRRIQVIGASGRFVITTAYHEEQRQEEIEVLQPAGDQLTLIGTMRFPAGDKLTWAEIDRDRQEIIIAAHHQWDTGPARPRIAVYGVPALNLIKEMLLRDQATSVARIGRLVFFIGRNTPQRLEVLDLDTGSLLAQLKLDDCWNDDPGGYWAVFADPYGFYVGVHGSSSVQLFSVRAGPHAEKQR